MLNNCKNIDFEDKTVPEGIARLDTDSNNDIDLIAEVLTKPSALGTIRIGYDKHFYSKGAFNLIQLVLYLLNQTGPAHVFISSYSINEQSLATLRRYVDSGKILSIRFLIDNRVRTISPKPFSVLVQSFEHDYKCCALHAKVALIYNDKYTLSVVGSQNATHNPKLERGIIHTSKKIFEFDLKTLNHEFDIGTT